MQLVSANYNPYADIIKADASVEFSLIATNASKVASSSGSTPTPYTSIAQTHNEIIRNSLKLASFEPDIWLLDGSFTLPSRNGGNGETGWFSEAMSDANGNINVSLTYNFATSQNSAGFTLVFDTRSGEVASDFTVTTYHDSSVISSIAINGNESTKVFFDLQSYGYNKVVVNFKKTSRPYRRVRLTEFIFGQTVKFDGSSIKDMRIVREVAQYGEKLPASMMRITIDNSDNSYNVLNPFGVYRFLQEGQGLTASLFINGEAVEMGKFYFESATANDDALTATIVAYDLFWRLDKTVYNKGTTGTWTALQAIQAILADAGLSVTLDINATAGARTVQKCIPQNTTHREALRMVAQAARMSLYFNREGALVGVDRYAAWSRTNNAVLSLDKMIGFGNGQDNGLINTVTTRQRDEYSGITSEYSANNVIPGEPIQTRLVQNPVAPKDTTMALYVLNESGYRNRYTLPVQGNPALDLLDTIDIQNAYGDTDHCRLLKIETTYDGAITDSIVAIAELRTPPLLNVANVSGGVRLEWQRVPGAAEYQILYALKNATSWSSAAYVSGDTVDYVIPSSLLTSGSEYRFTVRCITRNHAYYTSNYDTKGLSIVKG